MAVTAYPVGHPLAVKLWAKKLFVEALAATWFAKFIGESSGSLIQLKTDTQKSNGDRITIGLRMQLTGAGIQGDGTLEGNEEALTTFSDNLFIDQLRHAVRTAGKMSQQRVLFDIRTEAKDGLVDWWKGRLDTSFFNQLAGYTGQTDTRYTGNQAAIGPTTTAGFQRTFVAQSTASTVPESSLSATTTQYLLLSDIDRCVNMAKTAVPLIRPVMVDGEEMFAMFLHPNQVRQLRTATSTGQWLDIQKAAMTGGRVKDNPIFTGALGVYNQTILYEALRVPNTVTANASAADQTPFRRAVFCGAQSAAIAFGKDYGSDGTANWAEEEFDYGNQLGVAGGLIFGIKKMVFNSVDFGTIVVSSYAPAP